MSTSPPDTALREAAGLRLRLMVAGREIVARGGSVDDVVRAARVAHATDEDLRIVLMRVFPNGPDEAAVAPAAPAQASPLFDSASGDVATQMMSASAAARPAASVTSVGETLPSPLEPYLRGATAMRTGGPDRPPLVLRRANLMLMAAALLGLFLGVAIPPLLLVTFVSMMAMPFTLIALIHGEHSAKRRGASDGSYGISTGLAITALIMIVGAWITLVTLIVRLLG